MPWEIYIIREREKFGSNPGSSSNFSLDINRNSMRKLEENNRTDLKELDANMIKQWEFTEDPLLRPQETFRFYTPHNLLVYLILT